MSNFDSKIGAISDFSGIGHAFQQLDQQFIFLFIFHAIMVVGLELILAIYFVCFNFRLKLQRRDFLRIN